MLYFYFCHYMAYTYKYPRAMVTVDALIVKKEKGLHKVLLIKRKNQPFQGKWALPGGFIEMNESLCDSARRELEEETGLKNIEIRQLRAFGNPGRDPRGRNISVVYYGFANKDAKAKAADDAKDSCWADLNNLPELGFDHKKIINFFMDTIDYKKIN